VIGEISQRLILAEKPVVAGADACAFLELNNEETIKLKF
jgi:hypothetical protein